MKQPLLTQLGHVNIGAEELPLTNTLAELSGLFLI
jgi:hypothetical protein